MSQPRRAPKAAERGVTLVEAMIAVLVLLTGATGTIAVHAYQVNRNAEARRVSEASALAQDLAENMSLWAWDDVRLTDVDTSNNPDLGDTAYRFEGSSFTADHSETELGSSYTGLASRAGFERYWNVAEDAVQRRRRIAVIVRWQHGGGWHRVVVLTTRADMSGVGP